MTDYNVRDVFFLLTGRCGHKWVADGNWDACPTCGDWEVRASRAVEPITVNFRYTGVLRKVERRIQRAIRANRHKKRKTAAVISLAAHRPWSKWTS